MMAEPTEGFHLGYKLREDPVYAHIPIIIVSGISEKTGFNFSKEKETDYIKADEFLDKPVSPQTLLSKVATLLGAEAGAATRPTGEAPQRNEAARCRRSRWRRRRCWRDATGSCEPGGCSWRRSPGRWR